MNHHAGNCGDVYKHLLLSELLMLMPPDVYVDCHAGLPHNQVRTGDGYDYRDEPGHGGITADQFLAAIPDQPELARSEYATQLRSEGIGYPAFADGGPYPGSSALAWRILGPAAYYILADSDPETLLAIESDVASLGADWRVETQSTATDAMVSATWSRGWGFDLLAFLDPFEWGPVEDDLVRRATQADVPTVVWYPLLQETPDPPVILRTNRFTRLEATWRPGPGVRDLTGAGLALAGVPDVYLAILTALRDRFVTLLHSIDLAVG